MTRIGNWANSFSLAALLAGGLVLLAVYGHDATRRLDGALLGNVSELMERTTAGTDGALSADAASTRSTRAYSGEYWQIATPTPAGPKVLLRSRSLSDEALPAPPKGSRDLVYDATGPLGQPLRVAVRQSLLPGQTEPVMFMAAQDRSSVDQDVQAFALRLFAVLGLAWIGGVAAPLLAPRKRAPLIPANAGTQMTRR